MLMKKQKKNGMHRLQTERILRYWNIIDTPPGQLYLESHFLLHTHLPFSSRLKYLRINPSCCNEELTL